MRIFKRDTTTEDAVRIKRYFERYNHFFKNYIYTDGLSRKEEDERFPSDRTQPLVPEVKKLKRDFPIGVTEFGEVVCIPKPPEPMTMGMFGERGSGKTLLAQRCIEGHYHYFDSNVAIINDHLRETPPWILPNLVVKFRKMLYSLNENPYPLPVIPLYPKSNVKINQKYPHLKIKIDFSDFMENIQNWVELEASRHYLSSLDFLDCNSYDDFLFKLKEMDAPKRQLVTMVRTVKSRVDTFIKRGIINFDKNYHSKIYLSNDESIGNPIPQILKTGLIPSLITSGMEIEKKTFAPFQRNIVIDLIDHKNRKFFGGKDLMIFNDELSSIMDNEEAVESVREAIVRGRTLGIGFTYCTQNPYKIDDDILTNTKYEFIFQLKGINDIKKFKLDRDTKKELPYLKKFEFYAKTDEKFVVYDILGNRSYETIGPIKCRVIPPMSHHVKKVDEKVESDFFHSFGIIPYFLHQRGIKIYPNDEDKIKKRIHIFQNSKKGEIKKRLKFSSLVEYSDLRKVFYKEEGIKLKEINYKNIADRGYYIIKTLDDYGKDFFEIIYVEDLGNRIPIKSLPNNISLVYNLRNNEVRLNGKNCDATWWRIK